MGRIRYGKPFKKGKRIVRYGYRNGKKIGLFFVRMASNYRKAERAYRTGKRAYRTARKFTRRR